MALSTYCTTTCVDIDLGMTFLPQRKLAKRKKNLSSLWGWFFFLGTIDDSHLNLFIFFYNSPCKPLV